MQHQDDVVEVQEHVRVVVLVLPYLVWVGKLIEYVCVYAWWVDWSEGENKRTRKKWVQEKSRERWCNSFSRSVLCQTIKNRVQVHNIKETNRTKRLDSKKHFRKRCSNTFRSVVKTCRQRWKQLLENTVRQTVIKHETQSLKHSSSYLMVGLVWVSKDMYNRERKRQKNILEMKNCHEPTEQPSWWEDSEQNLQEEVARTIQEFYTHPWLLRHVLEDRCPSTMSKTNHTASSSSLHFQNEGLRDREEEIPPQEVPMSVCVCVCYGLEWWRREREREICV